MFRNQRGSAQGCANYLANELGLPSAEGTLAALPSGDPSGSSSQLRACLAGGTAFHSTNLAREERALVERAYRDPDNGVRALAATTTVAAGINTPASTVILAEQQFVGEDGRPFSVAEYKNMAGRAGRLGYQEEGKSIILADSDLDRRALFQRYVLGDLEPLASSFQPDEIDTWIIRLLAQTDRILKDDVVTVLANTYGGFLGAKERPDWRDTTLVQLEELLDKMLRLDLLEEEDGFISLTLLGRACGRSLLSLPSALRLVELLELETSVRCPP